MWEQVVVGVVLANCHVIRFLCWARRSKASGPAERCQEKERGRVTSDRSDRQVQGNQGNKFLAAARAAAFATPRRMKKNTCL